MLLCRGPVVTSANDLDHLVDVDNGNEETLDEVEAILPLAQAIAASPLGYLDAVVDKDLEQLPKAQSLGLTADQGNVVDGEALFERGEAVELLENELWVKA